MGEPVCPGPVTGGPGLSVTFPQDGTGPDERKGPVVNPGEPVGGGGGGTRLGYLEKKKKRRVVPTRLAMHRVQGEFVTSRVSGHLLTGPVG